MDKKSYVYIILNPLKPGRYQYQDITFFEEPFYVGIGKRRRAFIHFQEHSLKEKSHKNNTIKSILKTGKKPTVVFFSKNLERKKAEFFEIFLISQIGRRDLKKGPLTNKTDGGDADTSKYRKYPKGKDIMPHIMLMVSKKKNFNHSEETKAKMSLASKNKLKSEKHKKALSKAWKKRKKEGKYIKQHSQSTKDKISKANKGKVNSPEAIKRMIQTKTGSKRPIEVKNKISNTLKRLYREGKRFRSKK